MPSWVQPTAAAFQVFFARDFEFTTDPANLELVSVNDINRAMTDAIDNFPPGLFSTDDVATNAFMYLTAFCMVRNIQMATKGLASQGNKFMISSNSVAGVSTSFTIPERYSKDPFLASLTGNQYGQRYLELIIPYLTGAVFVVPGMGICGPGVFVE